MPNISTGDVSLIIAAALAIWQIVRERGKPRVDLSTSKELEERVRKSLETSMLSENKRLSERVTFLETTIAAREAELTESRQMIVDLTNLDRKREADMIKLTEQFERGELLRENIEKALETATARIKQLETDNAELQKRVATMEHDKQEWDAERRVWRDGVWRVIKQLTDRDIVPAWRPPDTDQLGKFPNAEALQD